MSSRGCSVGYPKKDQKYPLHDPSTAYTGTTPVDSPDTLGVGDERWSGRMKKWNRGDGKDSPIFGFREDELTEADIYVDVVCGGFTDIEMKMKVREDRVNTNVYEGMEKYKN